MVVVVLVIVVVLLTTGGVVVVVGVPSPMVMVIDTVVFSPRELVAIKVMVCSPSERSSLVNSSHSRFS